MPGIEQTVRIVFEGEGDGVIEGLGKIGEASDAIVESLKKQQDEFEATTTKGVAAGSLIADAISGGAEKAKEALGQIIEKYSDVQLAIAKITTIAPEVNTGALEKDLQRISTKLGATQKDIADGVYNIFGSLDVTQKQAVELVELYTRGSIAAQTQTEKFGSAVNGVLNAYKLNISEAARVSDIFFNAVNVGVITGEQLASNLGKVVPNAKNAGVSIELLGTFIAAVTREGLGAEEALTSLSDFFGKLDSKEVRDALSSLGVDRIDKVTGEFRSVDVVLGEVVKKFQGLSTVQQKLKIKEIFTDDEARRAFTILLSQIDFIQKQVAQTDRIAGQTGAASEKILATFSAQSQIATAQASALAVAIGKVVLESKPAQVSLGAVATVLKFLTANVGATLALTAAVGALALAFTLLNSSAIPSIVTGFGTLVTTLRTVVLSMALVGTAGQTLGSVLTVATLGWGALIAAVVAAGFAINGYVQSQKLSVEQQAESIEGSRGLIVQTRAQGEALKILKEEGGKLTLQHKELSTIYATLDLASQSRVKRVVDEKGATAALTEEIQRLNKANRLQLDAKLSLLATDSARAFAELEAAQSAKAEAEAALERAQKFAQDIVQRNQRTGAVLSVETREQQIAALNKRVEETGREAEKAEKKFSDYKEALKQGAAIVGTTAGKYVEAKEKTRELGATTQQFKIALDATTQSQQKVGVATAATTDAIKTQAEALKDLKKAASDRKEGISDAVLEIAEQAGNAEEARRKFQEKLKKDDEFRGKFDAERRVAANRKVLDELTSFDQKRSRSIATAADQVRQLSNEIAKAQREIDALKAGGGQIFTLTLQKEDVEEEKRRLEEILKLRRALGLQQQAALPASRQGQEALLEGLRREDELRKNLLKLSGEQEDAEVRLRLAYAASTVAVVDAQTKADTAFLEGMRKRREAYTDTVADLANLIRRQRDEERGLGDALIQAQVSVFRENLDAGARVQREGFEAVSRLLLAQGDVFKENPILRQAVAIANRPPQVSPVVQRLDTTNELLRGIRSDFAAGKPNDGAAATAFAGLLPSTGNKRIDAGILNAAARAGIDPRLLYAMAKIESGFDPNARSDQNAQGLVQLLPETFRRLGGRGSAFNIEENLNAAARYIAKLQGLAGGDVGGIAIGYHAGEDGLTRGVGVGPKTRRHRAKFLNALREIGFFGSSDEGAPTGEADEDQGFFGRVIGLGRQALGAAGSFVSNLFSGGRTASAGTPVDDPRATAGVFRQLLGAIGLDAGGSDAAVNARGRALQSTPDGQRQLADAAAVVNNRTQLLSIETQIAELRAGKGAAAAKLLSDAETQRATALRDSIAAAQSAEERLARLRAGDPAAVETVRNNANAAITNSQIQTAERVIGLQEEIARAGEGAAERMKVAYLESVRARQTAEESAAASIIRSQVELADKAVFSQTQATAKVLDYLNRNTKSVSEIVADLRINTFDGLFKVIDGGLDRVTRKLGFAGSILKQFVGDLTRNLLSRFLGLGAGGGGGFGIPGFGGGVTGTPGFAGGGGFGGALGALLTGGGGGGFLGLGSVAGTPGFAGGGGFAGRIGALISGGGGFGIPGFGGGVTGTPGFTGSTLSQQAALALGIGPGGGRASVGASSSLSQALGAVLGRGGIGSGQFSALGLLKGFGPALPLLGLGLGGQVGGLLGAVGGGLLGLSGAAALGAFGGLGAGTATIGGLGTIGLGGGIAALFTNPFTILAGVGLLVGGFLLGRAKQRGRDERERDRLFGEAQKQLQQLLDDVNRDRVDGGSAIQQARQVRDDYQKAVNSLKTGSVRRSAQTTGRRGEPSQFSVVDGLVKKIEEATDAQNRRKEVDQRLVPEFDGGGVVGSQRMAKILAANGIGLRGFTGMLPGVYRGRGFDTIPIVAQGGELVLNPRQQRALDLTPAKLAAAGVPDFNGAPKPQVEYASGGVASGGFGFDGGQMVVYLTCQLVMGTGFATELFVTGARSREGQEIQVRTGAIQTRNGGRN